MPSIKLSNGKIKYKTYPLYLGVKRIDKEVATENLILLKTILDKYQVSFGLIAGTLLGAVREKDFISHDEDIDLFFLDEQRQNLLDLLPLLKEEGFDIARYDRRGLLSIVRKGEYIDLYFFSNLCKKLRHCCGWCVPEDFIIKTTTIEFKGLEYTIPFDYEGYLVYQYGYNWKTPIKWADFEMPKWKRKLNEWKAIIKDLMPDFIFYSIVRKTEKRKLKKYIPNIERYNELYNTSIRIPTHIL